MKRPHALILGAMTLTFCPSLAGAATLYASGQLLVPGDPAIPAGQPGHDDSRENYLFEIDSATGDATPVSRVPCPHAKRMGMPRRPVTRMPIP